MVDDTVEYAEVEATAVDNTSSRVLSSATSLVCVATMEHLRQMQSLRISNRV